ncbi:hypothetical protein DFH09DRAFT_1320746 [Mycena vulgaris]|nr:hypothetical protein DFH09DRAFT_1320746 [Mycena vulgaris]
MATRVLGNPSLNDGIIFGVDGTIAEDDFDGHAVPDADPLDEGIYCFMLSRLEHAVDSEAMTYKPVSEITNKRDNFRTSVAERDVCCTFTNGDDESSHAIHIVPCMKHIIESRIPDVGEDVSNLMRINDIRNGMLVSNNLHPLIDRKKMGILKTPNRVLACDDIPDASRGGATGSLGARLQIASGSGDYTVHVWDAEAPTQLGDAFEGQGGTY